MLNRFALFRLCCSELPLMAKKILFVGARTAANKTRAQAGSVDHHL
jgi:hypothetical protein